MNKIPPLSMQELNALTERDSKLLAARVNEDELSEFNVEMHPYEMSRVLDPQVVRLHAEATDTDVRTKVATFADNSTLGGAYLSEKNKPVDNDTTQDRSYLSRQDRLETELLMARVDIEQIAENPTLHAILTERTQQLPDSLKQRIVGPHKKHTEVGADQLSASEDDGVIADFLEWNQEYIAGIAEERKAELHEAVQDFTDTMRRVIRKQNFPLSEEQFDARMDDIRVEFADPLVKQMENYAGLYSLEARTAYISVALDDVKSTVFHELLHHVSGHTLRETNHFKPDYEFNEYAETKVIDGTRTGIASFDGDSGPRWLNEAITEQLTQVLLSDKLSDIDFNEVTVGQLFDVRDYGVQLEGSYRTARVGLFVVSDLIEDSASAEDEPPLHTMVKAYFEDASPGNEQPHNSQKFWATVYRAIKAQRRPNKEERLFAQIFDRPTYMHLEELPQKFEDMLEEDSALFPVENYGEIGKYRYAFLRANAERFGISD